MSRSPGSGLPPSPRLCLPGRSRAPRGLRDPTSSYPSLFSSTSVPMASTLPDQPGRTTQVDSLNSTMAGPSTSDPCPMLSRSSTGTSTHSPSKFASRTPAVTSSAGSGSSSSGFSTATVETRRRFTSSTASSSMR